MNNVLNVRDNLGNFDLEATMATKKDELRDDALVFLERHTESWQDYLMSLGSRLLQMCVIYCTTLHYQAQLRG